MDEFFKYLGAFALALATAWLKQFLEKRKEKSEQVKAQALKSKRSAIDFTTEFHLRVINAENIMMRAFGPCRMFVYHFYNGDFSLAKLSLQKHCIRHEIVEGPYVPYMKDHFEGKPVPEMFANMFKEVFDNG